MFVCYSSNAYTANLQVVILDVGMGQSVLLVDDGHAVLVDTGIAEYSDHLLERMNHYGVNTLDYIILSHLHPDHAGGYGAMRAAWPNSPVIDSCLEPQDLHPSEQDAFFDVHSILQKDILRKCLTAGDELDWRGHKIQMLWPIAAEGTTLNRDSIVLLFHTQSGNTLLIMGDVDRTVEQTIHPELELQLKDRGVDLYVAAHHAAADSTDPDFLKMLHPQVSIISVGAENPFNYPSKERLSVLRKHSNKVLRTDKDGEIHFIANSEFERMGTPKHKTRSSIAP